MCIFRSAWVIIAAMSSEPLNNSANKYNIRNDGHEVIGMIMATFWIYNKNRIPKG
jgi:hypothetical protein